MEDCGYGTFSNVIRPDLCDLLIEALSEQPIGRSRAGSRHLMENSAVRDLAQSDPMLGIARQFVGQGAVPFRATLFAKTLRANWLVVWHQDTALPVTSRIESSEWGPWSLKGGTLYAHAPAWALQKVIALRLHLDASAEENGPLRVIPGTHLAGVLTDAQVVEIARKSESITCHVLRGGVLAMRPLLIHSSSKLRSNASRRVLHIEYAESLDLAHNVRLAIA